MDVPSHTALLAEEGTSRRVFLGGLVASTVAGWAGAIPAAAEAANQPAGTSNWKRVAAQFSLAPGMVYLNSGSEGSLPRPLQAHYAQAIARWAASPSQAFFSDPLLDQAQPANRAAIGAFVGAAAEDVVITDNTTMGLSMVLMGLPFAAGDEVVATQHEHFALLSPLNVLTQRSGIKVIELPLPSPAPSAAPIVDAFRNAITPRTRAFCFSHVNWTNGLRMPVKELCQLARDRGILTLIDGAHGLGMLDLDLPALGCDFYACPGHKWLNGPPASGLLYLRDAKNNPWRLVPTLSEGSLLMGSQPPLTISEALQMRGSTNGPGFLTMAETTRFASKIGKSAIEARILALAGEVKRRAIELWGPECLFSPHPGPESDPLASGITAFVPSADPKAAYNQSFVTQVVNSLVTKHRIWVRATFFPAPPGAPGPQINTIRVSTNIFNSPEDISRFFKALQAVTAQIKPVP